jgi:hypothetical protein
VRLAGMLHLIGKAPPRTSQGQRGADKLQLTSHGEQVGMKRSGRASSDKARPPAGSRAPSLEIDYCKAWDIPVT